MSDAPPITATGATPEEARAKAFDVNAALRAVLEASRDAIHAARRRDLWRDQLDREARRRYAEEDSAPAWNTPKLGKVRLDPKPASAHVTNPGEFATYVLGIAPDEVTAIIELAGKDLEEALSALEFAGIAVTSSAAEVRPAYLKPFLEGLEVHEADPDARNELDEPAPKPALALRVLDDGVVDEVPGVGVTPASATLVVTIDPQLKRETLARVDHQLAELVEPPPARADLPPALAAAVAAHGLVPASQLERAGVEVLPGQSVDLTRLEDPTPLDVAARQRAAAAERAATIRARYGADVEAHGEPDPANLKLAHPPAEPACLEDAPDVTVVVDPTLATTVVAPAVEVPYTARPGFQFAPTDPPAPVGPSREALEPRSAEVLANGYRSDYLKRACRALRLPTAGTKLELAARLVEAGANTTHRLQELTA